MNAKHFRTLIAIEQKGSLSAAAIEMGMTVSSVSYTIRQLEDELGEKLLNRDTYRVTLTEAGRCAVEYGNEILRLQASLREEVTNIANGWERELCIATTNLVRSKVLYQWIKEFYQLNSGTRVRVIGEVYTGTWDALYTKRADLVIGAVGRPPHEVDVQHVPIGKRELVLAMSAGHPLAQLPSPICMEQVRQYRLVDAGDSSRLINRSNSAVNEIYSHDQLLVPDLFAQREAILSGFVIAFMPHYMVEAEVASGRIIVREVANRDSSVELFACWRKSSRGRALEWFAQRLLQSDYRQQFL